jgi:hypothetical protein
MGLLDYLTATAVSLTVSGNTGVAPFLTLLIVGLLEKANPDLLHMEGNMEAILSSWSSLAVLSVMTVLEFLSMCIPVVDEFVDTIMTFVLPVMSSLGSVSTFGLWKLIDSHTQVDENNRELNVLSNTIIFFQVIVVLIGIGLAFALHGLKMILRIIGVGWLTNCLTILETMWVVISIVIAVFIRPIAIIIAAFLCCGALLAIKRAFWKKQKNKPENSSTPIEGTQDTQDSDAIEAGTSTRIISSEESQKLDDIPIAQALSIESYAESG